MFGRTRTRLRLLLPLTVAAIAVGCETPVEPETATLDGEPELSVANAKYDSWSVVDLGVANSRAVDVNANRQVVGTMSISGYQQGFLWDNGSLTYLSHFIPVVIGDNGLVAGTRFGRPAVRINGSTTYLLPGYTKGRVHDMNDAGTVVGSMEVAGSVMPQPFVWKNGVLDVMPFYGHAGAVSPAGYVSGFAAGELPGDPNLAFGVWVRTPSGAIQISNNYNTKVWGVDDYGVAVTTSYQSGCLRPNWVRPQTGLDLTGTGCGRPADTNRFGYVVANSETVQKIEARLFIRASQMRPLLGFGSGSTSWAHDVSDNFPAPRVAGSAIRGSDWHAVVWSYANGGRPSALPEGRYVTASSAVAINSNGDAAGLQWTGTSQRAALWIRN